MWLSYIYGIHWEYDGRMYYDEISAESEGDAEEFFLVRKRDEVTLVRIEYVRPNEGGVREPTGSPYSPFDPLKARRRTDIDEDAA